MHILDMNETHYSLSSASFKLRIPLATLRSWRARCAIGPFSKDPYTGREILTDEDLAAIMRYAEGRKRAQGLGPETP
jgi:hypothetical protein